jgi:hypothetical protein
VSAKNIATFNRKLSSIRGACLSLHLADGWAFDPIVVGSDIFALYDDPSTGSYRSVIDKATVKQ